MSHLLARRSFLVHTLRQSQRCNLNSKVAFHAGVVDSTSFSTSACCSIANPFKSWNESESPSTHNAKDEDGDICTPDVSAEGSFRDLTKIDTIEHHAVPPAIAPVTASLGHECLATYNRIMPRWRNIKHAIYLPGGAPVWQTRGLPYQVKAVKSLPQCQDDAQSHLWEVPMYVVKGMQPDFWLDDVDVMTDVQSLEDLLDFLRNDSRLVRSTATVVKNTLFLNRIQATDSTSGFTRGFGRNFTRNPKGTASSKDFFRIVRYQLGTLNIAVLARTHARFNSAAAPMEHLKKLENVQQDKNKAFEAYVNGSFDAGDSAMLRTVSEYKQLVKEPYFSTLWFSRIPYIIRGLLGENDFIQGIKVDHVGELYQAWERHHWTQYPLRRLCQLLSKVRQMTVEGGGKCALTREKGDREAGIDISVAPNVPDPLSAKDVLEYWRSPRETLPITPSETLSNT